MGGLGPVNRGGGAFFVSDSQPNMIPKWVMVKYGDMRDATNNFFQDDVAASTPQIWGQNIHAFLDFRRKLFHVFKCRL